MADTRRRYASDPPEGYKQSRSALREIYGTRRIDATARQSENDQTPSGRARRNAQEAEDAKRAANGLEPKTVPSGYTDSAAQAETAQEFFKQFQPRYAEQNPIVQAEPGWKRMAPTGGAAPVAPATAESPSDFLDWPGTFPTRPAATPVAPVAPVSATPPSNFLDWPGTFPQASQAPTPLSLPVATPSPVAATKLASLLPQTPSTGYVPPWRKQQMQPSYMSGILSGASKYLT